MGPALSRRREPFRERLLVGRDAVRDRRPRDRAGVPRRVEDEALRGARGYARNADFSIRWVSFSDIELVHARHDLNFFA